MQAGSRGNNKNKPGRKPEHTEAIIENASRTLAVEVEKASQPMEVVDVIQPSA